MEVLQTCIGKDREQFILIPIPLHKKRLLERGFNQSECLAQCFSQRLNIPVISDILIRTKYTPPQALLPHASDRMKNMKDVFGVSEAKKHVLAGKTVLLVDDVWTTGATMTQAARILKHSGTAKVFCITVAQS